MLERLKSRRTSRYLVITVIFLLVVTVSLGYLLVSQTKKVNHHTHADQDARHLQHRRGDDYNTIMVNLRLYELL